MPRESHHHQADDEITASAMNIENIAIEEGLLDIDKSLDMWR